MEQWNLLVVRQHLSLPQSRQSKLKVYFVPLVSFNNDVTYIATNKLTGHCSSHTPSFQKKKIK